MQIVGPITNFKQWKDHILRVVDGRKIICSISGGKDSTCMALLFKEADIEFDDPFIEFDEYKLDDNALEESFLEDTFSEL